MEERRLARARGGDEGDEFPRPDREIGTPQDFQGALGLGVAALDLCEEQGRDRRGVGGSGAGAHGQGPQP